MVALLKKNLYLIPRARFIGIDELLKSKSINCFGVLLPVREEVRVSEF